MGAEYPPRVAAAAAVIGDCQRPSLELLVIARAAARAVRQARPKVRRRVWSFITLTPQRVPKEVQAMPKSFRDRLADLAREVEGPNTNPPSSVELRQRRQQALEDLRTIADSAERQNRSLTDAEQARFSEGEELFREFTRQIEAAEAREAEEVEQSVPLGGGMPGGFRLPRNRDRGAEVLTRDQSMAEHVRALGYRVEGASDLGFGRMVRGMLLGDWRGADPERRALLESNAGLGGVLVPAPMSARDDRHRPRPVPRDAGRRAHGADGVLDAEDRPPDRRPVAGVAHRGRPDQRVET